MRKIGYILILIFFIAASVFAQGYKGKGRVMGYVYDEAGNPLEGIKIKLFCERGQSGFETATDAKGKWRAFYIRGGPWKIEFEKDGYMPKKMKVQLNEFGKNPNIEVNLKKIVGLVVTGNETKEELIKGNALFDEEKYEEAIQIYREIIEKMPNIYLVYQNIGNCYFKMEMYKEAEDSYLKFLEKEPDNYKTMLSIGNTYANRGRNDKALEWYNKIDFENMNDPLVLFNIGSSFYTQSKFEEAEKYYRKAVKIKNDFLDALYQLGLVYLNMTKYQDSIDVFNKYLIHDQQSERAAQVKGFLEFLKKKINGYN